MWLKLQGISILLRDDDHIMMPVQRLRVLAMLWAGCYLATTLFPSSPAAQPFLITNWPMGFAGLEDVETFGLGPHYYPFFFLSFFLTFFSNFFLLPNH